MQMQRRIDPLILDRAPWLASRALPARLIRPMLDRLLSYQRTLALAEALKDQPAEHVMASMARLLTRQVVATGLDKVPTSGPALIVANHPTGIADGLALMRVLVRRRPDAFFFANADILKVLPQLETVITPVEWRQNRRSAAKTRETLRRTKAALSAGRIGVIFPSGRLAKRQGLRLVERPWMSSAASIARKHGVPVIPIHICARNSVMFYGCDLLHPSLRDITLFHEVLNKARQPFAINIGEPIAPASLPRCATQATETLRQRCLELGETEGHGLSLLQTSPPLWPPRVKPRWT